MANSNFIPFDEDGTIFKIPSEIWPPLLLTVVILPAFLTCKYLDIIRGHTFFILKNLVKCFANYTRNNICITEENAEWFYIIWEEEKYKYR